MVTFIGEYTAKTDDKGRIVFPSALKACMGSGEDLRFVVRKDMFEDCLEMYTFEEWERISTEVKSKLDPFNREHARFWREFTRDRAVVAPDGKLGSITIPRKLLEAIGVTKEVVFSGNDYKIEIWDKDKFAGSRLPDDEYIAIAERLSRQQG